METLVRTRENMYKVDVRVDAKESAAVERRRIQEQQRQSRIFDTRQRLIGVDVNAFEQQVQERKIKEEISKQRDDAFASDMIRNDKIVQLMEERQAKDIRKLNMTVNDYRKEHQRAVDRKEFYLNDPDAKKKDLPARVSDDDPRCSVSGVQKLLGEDLGYEGRKKDQQEQNREWTKLQVQEKEHHAGEEEYSKKLYDLKAIELDERLVALTIAEQETKRRINMATKELNRQQASEKVAKERLNKTQEEEDNFTEMSNMISGDMLSENPDVAISAFGPNRVIPDRWKGMSPEQVKNIRDTQAAQREEKRRLSEEEDQMKREWDRRRVAEARAGLLLERKSEKTKKEIKKKLAEENRQLAMEQKARMEHLNKVVYTNEPSTQYFSQFNTSSR